jgi:hypothetical protein
MSNGNCTQHCRDEGGFAFAVIQYEDCYCSNLIPSQQTDIANCRKICPGYDKENCGSIDSGLFIYIQNGNPSGTAPGPSSAQPTTPTVSSSAPPPPPPLPATTQATSSSTPVTVSTPCLVELQALLGSFLPSLAHSASLLFCSCIVNVCLLSLICRLTLDVAVTGRTKSDRQCSTSRYKHCRLYVSLDTAG